MKLKILHITILIFLCSLSAFSQTKLTVEAPTVVEVGEVFRVTYTVNANPRGGFILSPANGLEQVGHPQQGHSSQISNVNGRRTQSYNVSATYHFKAMAPGKFRIPTAKTIVNGNTVISNTHTIEVVGSTKAKQQIKDKQLEKQLSEDVFARVYANKHNVYVGEAIYVSIKIYTRYQLSLNDHKYPDFNGFYKKDLESPENLRPEQEVINGKSINSYLFKKMVVFPQKAGTLTISPFEADCDVLVPAGRSFWGVQHNRERKFLKSKANVIEVKPLPAGKPASFNGAVGKFTATVKTDTEEYKQNEAFTYRIKIKGVGNISLIQKPTIQFPQDFEVYDPKVIEKVNATSQGEEGSKIFEYLIIPRHEGTFVLPQYEFSYFNTKTKKYENVIVNEIPIQVQKGVEGAGNVVSNYSNTKEQVQYYGNDILYIKTGNLNLISKPLYIIKSIGFYAWYIIPSLLLLVLAIVRRKQIKQNQDIAKVRNRKANKESQKRLKQARLALEAGNDSQYYEEVAKALWGYIADKYTIQVADLTTDSVKDYLVERTVPQENIKELLEVLQQCEMARFAPSVNIQGKENLYTRTSDLIQTFEQIVK